MITFTRQDNGEKANYQKGKIIGEGKYARVYELQDRDSQTDWVCKEIKGASKIAIKEVHRLHELGLLVGYGRHDNIFHIIMKKVNEVTLEEALKTSLSVEKLYYSAYQELKRFHRLGYVHLDCHPLNFIVTGGEPKEVKLIDYASSQRATYFSNFLDYVYFAETVLGNHWYRIFDFYFKEKFSYFSEHKAEVSIKGLGLVLLGMASYYGVPSLSISQESMKRLISAHFFQSLGHDLQGIFSPFPLSGSFLSGVFSFVSGAISWRDGPQIFLSQKPLSFDPLAWANTICLFQSAEQIVKATSNAVESVLPDSILQKKTDLLFQYVKPRVSKMIASVNENLFSTQRKKAI